MAVNEVGNINDPKEIKARAELAYEWIAKYSDDTQLLQYDEAKGHVNNFGHIDQDKIIEFILVSKYEPRTEVRVNLLDGLFSVNDRKILTLGKSQIPLGLLIENRNVTSSWGNKAKLIYLRHVRRDFKLGEGIMDTTITYELGWEANVDDKHEKHTILLSDHGRIAIPPDEYQGFESL
jgi:hypothetical protein